METACPGQLIGLPKDLLYNVQWFAGSEIGNRSDDGLEVGFTTRRKLVRGLQGSEDQVAFLIQVLILELILLNILLDIMDQTLFCPAVGLSALGIISNGLMELIAIICADLDQTSIDQTIEHLRGRSGDREGGLFGEAMWFGREDGKRVEGLPLDFAEHHLAQLNHSLQRERSARGQARIPFHARLRLRKQAWNGIRACPLALRSRRSE